VCTLALYLRRFAAYPLIVAANRDEFYDRPASSPRVIAHEPWVVGGQDLVAGGTWLGLNQVGMVVGLLNRRGRSPDPHRRSRGLLALEMLQCRSLEEALERLQREPGERYNGFNLLIATTTQAHVACNVDDRIELTSLQPGVHLLTNLDINDPTCPRIAKSARLFENLGAPSPPVLINELRAILSDHSTPLDPRSTMPPNNLCVHTTRFGTCSASILLYAQEEARFRHWFADGPPCSRPFVELPLPN
jgi:uncharacterized protein with NRDE domain